MIAMSRIPIRSGGSWALAMILLTGCAEEWVESRDGMSGSELERIRTIDPLEFSETEIGETNPDPERITNDEGRIERLRRMLEDVDPSSIEVGLDQFRASLLANNLQLEERNNTQPTTK